MLRTPGVFVMSLRSYQQLSHQKIMGFDSVFKVGFYKGKELKNWREILGLRLGWLLKREETWEGDIFGNNFWK